MQEEHEHEELIRPSPYYTTHGHWSGSEGRQYKHYIALIPLSRYREDRKDPEMGTGLYRRMMKYFSSAYEVRNKREGGLAPEEEIRRCIMNHNRKKARGPWTKKARGQHMKTPRHFC